ncbi:hypothetical protein [Aliiglaciecola aliphaticivorans]
MIKETRINSDLEHHVIQLERIGGLIFCLKQTGLNDKCCVDSGYAENVAKSEQRFSKLFTTFDEYVNGEKQQMSSGKVKTLLNELIFIRNEFSHMLNSVKCVQDIPSEIFKQFQQGIDCIFVLLFNAVEELESIIECKSGNPKAA